MLKHVAKAVIVPVGVALVLVGWQFGTEILPALGPGHATAAVQDYGDLAAESRRLDEEITRSQGFQQTLEPILDRLRRGRMTLAEATAILLDYTRTEYPRYLDILRKMPGAGSDHENIARCLLAHLRTRIQKGTYPPETRDVLRHLERDLS